MNERIKYFTLSHATPHRISRTVTTIRCDTNTYDINVSGMNTYSYKNLSQSFPLVILPRLCNQALFGYIDCSPIPLD